MQVNKEEMHHPLKHVLIKDTKAVMIDFERVHYTEKPKSTTQFCQFISSKKILDILKQKGCTHFFFSQDDTFSAHENQDVCWSELLEYVKRYEKDFMLSLYHKKDILDFEGEVEETGLKPVPKLKTKDKTKRELKDEKEGLQSKLTSVEDLLEFIDKKHSSGTIDDEEYSKRSKKLQTDVKKTKKKINVIDKLLDK